MQQIIQKLSGRPGIVLLIDCIGALASAILLLLIYFFYRAETGMPAGYLVWLIVCAFSLFSSSGTCFLLREADRSVLLKFTAIGNLLYCALTLLFMLLSKAEMTTFGVAYFSVEAGIILALAYVEWRVAAALRRG